MGLRQVLPVQTVSIRNAARPGVSKESPNSDALTGDSCGNRDAVVLRRASILMFGTISEETAELPACETLKMIMTKQAQMNA